MLVTLVTQVTLIYDLKGVTQVFLAAKFAVGIFPPAVHIIKLGGAVVRDGMLHIFTVDGTCYVYNGTKTAVDAMLQIQEDISDGKALCVI